MIGGLVRRNKAKNSGLVPFHSRTLVLGMPGTEESSSSPPPESDAGSDQEYRRAFQPEEHLAKDLAVARALAFTDRALQEHQLKIEGVEHCTAEDGALFVDGMSAMVLACTNTCDRYIVTVKIPLHVGSATGVTGRYNTGGFRSTPHTEHS